MVQGTGRGLHFDVQLCSATVIVLALSVIPIAFALEENGVIEMPFTENPPYIDGKWTTPEEWSDASETVSYSSEGNEFYLLVKHDREYLYFLVDLVNEQIRPTKDNIFAFPLYDYYGETTIVYNTIVFCFDTNNDGGNVLQNDDFCFWGLNDYYTEDWENIAVRGSGSQNREKISFPSLAKINWGFNSKNDPYEPGRSHIIYEAKIPISFLHKSDSYGFYIFVIPGQLVDRYSWPEGHDLFNHGYTPSAFGTVVAPEQTISAPPIPIVAVSSDSLDFGNTEISEKSSSKTVSITNIGTGILKINSIRVVGEFSISKISTPIVLLPNEKTTFEIVFAPIRTGEKSGTITISSNDLSKQSYRISVGGTGVEKGQGGCLIATATFGSELSPLVQQLREIRDNTLLQTESGKSFMSAFNDFYYSFSPTIADLERENPVFKEAVKVTITPLLITLSILNYVDIDSEEEMLGYGIGIILLNVGIYFGIPAFAILRIKKL